MAANAESRQTDAVNAPATLAEFLGPRAWRIVGSVPDLDLRARVVAGIESCALTLDVIDGVDLAEQELADLETPNVAAWNALAPSVRNALLAVRQAADQLKKLFPPPPPKTGDIEYDSYDEMFADSRETKVDAIVRGSSMNDIEQLGESINTLAAVLGNDIIGLGQKLRLPQVVGDRWFLLAELHTFLSQCTNCIEAIVATVLGALTKDNLDDVLPRYVDANARKIKLRSAMVDLCRDVSQYNAAIAQASGVELEILKTGLTERIVALSTSPAYKILRPQDKRAIILFRISLHSWERTGRSLTQLRQELEGFSKFLELMKELNWRDELADNDRRSLHTAYDVLESGVDVPMVKPYLERAYGRSAAVDELVRTLRNGIEPRRDVILRAVHQALGPLGAR